MSKGRKPTPDRLKVLRGTARADRMNPNAPKPDKDLPLAPEWLDARSREIFSTLADRLDAQGLASRSHTEMLSVLAMRLSELEFLSAVIQKHGPTYETTNMLGDLAWKARPEVAQRSEAARHCQSLLAEFGLSPSTLSKVSAAKDSKPNRWATLDPMEELLNER